MIRHEEHRGTPGTESPVRPRLHLTPDRGWVNDPLGLTYHHGTYHLFTQYVPGQTTWSPECHWGHATSTDLLGWTHQPVVLSPGDGDGGAWSGSIATAPGDATRLFYTSVQPDDVRIGRVRVAHPDGDEWTSWTKGDVVAELPAGVDAIAFRDPCVYHDGSRWRMLVGAGVADGTAAALSYRSDDLVSWAYDGILASRHTSETDPVWTGTVWECPQLFPMGDRWVLIVAVWEPWTPHYEAYAVGHLVDGRFVAGPWHRLTYGPSYYAPSTYVDQAGQRGLIHWLRDVKDPDGSWAGASSVPHVLTLHGDRVVAEPHPNITQLRRHGVVVDPHRDPTPISVTSDITWQPGTPPEASTAGEATLHVTVTGEPVLTITRSRATLLVDTVDGTWEMPYEDGEVRVILDNLVAEVFARTGTIAVPLPHVTDPQLHVTGYGQAEAHALARPAPLVQIDDPLQRPNMEARS